MRITKYLLTTLLLFLFGLLSIVYLTRLTFLDDGLSRVLGDVLSREVIIDELTVDLGSVITIRVGSITVANADWAGPQPLVQIDNLRVQMEPTGLIDTTPRLKSVTAGAVALDLQVNKQSQRNWQLPKTEIDVDAETPQPLEGLPVIIESLVIDSVAGQFTNPSLGPTKRFEIAIAQSTSADSIDLNLSGTVNTMPLQTTFTLSPLEEVLRLGAFNASLKSTFGEISAEATVTVAHTSSPLRPKVALSVSGPNIEYLTNALELPSLGSGPLAAQMTVDPRDEGVAFQVKGEFGQYFAALSGEVDALQTLNRGEITWSLSGPNIADLGVFMGETSLPMVPFSVTGSAVKTGPAVAIDQSRLTIGRLQVAVEGSIPNIKQPLVADATLHADIPELSIYRSLLALPEFVRGAATLTSSITSHTQGATINGQLMTELANLTVNGEVSADSSLIGSRLEMTLQGEDLALVTGPEAITHLGSGPWQLTSAIEVTPSAYRAPALTLETAHGVIRGSIEATHDLNHLSLALDTPQLAWWLPESMLPAGFSQASLRQPATLNTSLALSDAQLRATDLVLTLGDARLDGEMAFMRPASLSVDVTASIADVLHYAAQKPDALKGEIVPLTAQVKATVAPGHLIVESVRVRGSQGSSVDINGQLHLEDSYEDTEMQVAIDLKNLAHFSHLVGQSLPEQDVYLSAVVRGTADHLSAKAIQFRTGETLVKGDLDVDNTERPNIRFAMHSELVDLRPWFSQSDFIASPTANIQPKSRLIPDTSIDLSILNAFDADVALDVKRIATPLHTLTDLRIRLTNSADGLTLEQAEITDTANGQVALNGALQPTPSGIQASVNMQGTAVNIGVPALSKEQVPLLPRYDIDAFVYSEGATYRELAAQANGYVEIAGSSGKFPRLTGGLLTNDFIFELLNLINPERAKENHANVECVAIASAIETGRVTGNPIFVVATDKLDVIAKARIDLSTEKLFATFNTIPQKGLGLSASKAFNPFIGVGGTLAKPALTLDPKGAVIDGGLAVVTGGLSIVAKSFIDRLTNSEDPCSEAFKANAAQREAARKKFNNQMKEMARLPVN